ncbi:MAG: cobyrinate a,c-diamide synthase [Candidatus Odinarchaeota archaeon]
MYGKVNTTRGCVIAGTHSGVGKTSVALALMAAARKRGWMVQPYKVGPDFIDPGHHSRVTGRISRNLDGWMVDRQTNERIFREHLDGADLAVIEGVMGVFDGYDGRKEDGSTAQMAKWLGLPVLLVVDARSMARSAGALVLGFSTFDPDLDFLGVLFNRVGSPTHLEYLKQAISQVPGATCFGAIPRDESLHIPERHLGLVTEDEHRLDADYIDHLVRLMEDHVDLDRLLDALPGVSAVQRGMDAIPEPRVRIGIARDKAFCFYYEDNLDLLRQFGAELIFFSPLEERALPENCHGLYLGGGYPELFADSLSSNESLRAEIRRRAEDGMPIYAECGGFMYLCRDLVDMKNRTYPMADVFPMRVKMLERLRALGYRQVTLGSDSILGLAGTRVRGHEFHYSEIDVRYEEVDCKYEVAARDRSPAGTEGFSRWNVLAGYVHLHFLSNPDAPRHFVRCCMEYKENA